jgi:hypothetical protein
MSMTLTDATRIMCACVERGNAGYGTVCVVCMHGGGGLRYVRERWSTRATGRSVTGGSPGTLRARRVAGGVGHFAICLSSPIQIEAYAYLYIACLPSRHPCNQQPFLRETCSPLHAIPIIVLLVVVVVLLAPRLDPILAPLSVSLSRSS